ncbi:MAG TPA: class I SAM-dependent methyltransferase [Stellaceae bacterium]|nr:class I SAM-dependent methyltransferase [Stellaceae bacterium]
MEFKCDLETIRRRYRWLAPIYPLFELLWWLPSGIRGRAVDRLKLANGDRVAEIGYGTGRNLRRLAAAVGPNGKVYAVDCCEEMLAHAVKLRDRAGWRNVVPLLQDGAQLTLPEMVDGVLFSLSYSVIPDPTGALTAAWKHLRNGRRRVVMDGKLASGICGYLSRPYVVWLSRRTVLGNPTRVPTSHLQDFTQSVEFEEFNLGTYYICTATKTVGMGNAT